MAGDMPNPEDVCRCGCHRNIHEDRSGSCHNPECDCVKWEMDRMPMAREMAAQAWCDSETSGIEMDARLAESFARILSAWLDYAAQADRNTEYYRGLVQQIGERIGEEAYIADDGSRSEDILCAKVPELVAALKERSP